MPRKGHLEETLERIVTPCICLAFKVHCAMLSSSGMSDSLWPQRLGPARFLCLWGFFIQEYWSGLPCLPPGDLPNPGIEPRSPTLEADSLLSEPPGKPMLKPSMQDFKHDLTMGEMSAIVRWLAHSLVLHFLGVGIRTDLFQSCGHCWVFQICWHIECNTLMNPTTSTSFTDSSAS